MFLFYSTCIFKIQKEGFNPLLPLKRHPSFGWSSFHTCPIWGGKKMQKVSWWFTDLKPFKKRNSEVKSCKHTWRSVETFSKCLFSFIWFKTRQWYMTDSRVHVKCEPTHVNIEKWKYVKHYFQTSSLTSLCPWTWELTKDPRMWDVIGR